jgi:hypothetical protein
MNRSKFSFLHFFLHLSYLSLSPLLFLKQPDIVRLVSKNEIELPYGENLKKGVLSLKSVKL